MIDPETWCATRNQTPPPHGMPPWTPGSLAPSRISYYQRCFTDGVARQFWDGASWNRDADSPPHWRQVGDYPCWRSEAADIEYDSWLLK
jgi:hypothetical protein